MAVVITCDDIADRSDISGVNNESAYVDSTDGNDGVDGGTDSTNFEFVHDDDGGMCDDGFNDDGNGSEGRILDDGDCDGDTFSDGGSVEEDVIIIDDDCNEDEDCIENVDNAND